MKTLRKIIYYVLPALLLALISNAVSSQSLDGYKYNEAFYPDKNAVITNSQFNGYTNYWHDIYREKISYGNLFKCAIPDINKTIAQSKLDIADDMNIPGLFLQEGFIYNLFKRTICYS